MFPLQGWKLVDYVLNLTFCLHLYSMVILLLLYMPVRFIPSSVQPSISVGPLLLSVNCNVWRKIFTYQGPEVRSGDVPQPIKLEEGQEFNFTIRRGVSTEDTVSVNYDDFINDVELGDILLIDGMQKNAQLFLKLHCSSWCLHIFI